MVQSEYISTSEASARWQVSPRQVQRLINDGRIAGACKLGRNWIIPADTEKPSDLRKAEKEQTAVPYFTLPVRCHQLIFTPLYNKPGSADDFVQKLSYDEEAKTAAAFQLAYFRGETGDALKSAQALLKATSRPDVSVACMYIICLCAMYNGDDRLWNSAYDGMKNMSCFSPEEEYIKEFDLAGLDSGLYDKSSFPKWLSEGIFDPLPADCYPLARFIYLKYLMLSKGDPSISFVCGPIISQSKSEGALLSEIYCRVLTAIGFHDRGELDRASDMLDAAIGLALPDRLYAPFAEYRNELGLLLDERLEAADRNAVSAVRELNQRLMHGWYTLCGKLRGIGDISDLTQRERHAAKLVAKGLSNSEIARRMNVSVNSVKRYISVAMQKTQSCNRAELANAVVPGAITLP